MTTIYVLGAGFSKTCEIATDREMLDTLNPFLEPTQNEDGVTNTYIDAFREQNFHGQNSIGFETFMSTISALKYMPEFVGSKNNVFEEAEKAIRNALKRYLRRAVKAVSWNAKTNGGRAIMDFARLVKWQQDTVITFNYDLLLEAALQQIDVNAGARILHLHGTVEEKTIAWPTYKKLAYRNTRTKLATRWREAFRLLRDSQDLRDLVFIGYSMPPTDLEAKGLFNYTDWYNNGDSKLAASGRLVPSVSSDKHYSYNITVVDPSPDVKPNYSFFRKQPLFRQVSLVEWLNNRT